MKNIKSILLIIFSTLTFVMGFFSFQRKMESWTPLGFYIEDKDKGPAIVQVEAGSKAEELGIKTKDIIIEVNGFQGNASFFKKILLSNKNGSKILILRGDKIFTFNYIPPEGKVDTDYLIFSFIGGVFFIIGLITYFRESNNLTLIFSYIMVFSFTLFAIVPSGKVNDLWRSLYAYKTFISFLIFPLLINFFIYFPRIISLKKIKFLWVIYIPAVIISFLFIDGFLLSGKIFINEERIPLIFKIKFLYYFAYSTALILLFIFQWLRYKKPYQWKKWIWAISGILGCFPYIFFEVIYKDLGLDSGIPLWALALFMVLLPLSFSTALSGWKLENLSVYFLNTFYFLLSLFFGLFLYIFLNTFILKIFQEKIKASQNFVLFLSGFIISLILYLSRKKLFLLLDKIFGTKRIEIQEKISQFLQEMAFYKNPEKLLLDLFAILKSLFSLNYVNFYYYKEGKWDAFTKDEIIPQSLEGEEISSIKPGFKIFNLFIKNKKIGALILGEKEGDIPLSQWEISSIKNILTPLSFYFQNLTLLQELEKKYEELFYSQKFLETIFSFSPLGLLVLNYEGKIIKCNSSGKNILAIDEGINFFDIFPKMKNLIFEGQIINFGSKTLLLTQALIPSKEKETNYIIFINDLTEKINLQEALKEKEKMAVMGQFASTIAHELNTPLTAISSYAQILINKFPEDSSEYKKFLYIHRESMQMSKLINSLLEFSKSGRINYQVCSIKETINNTLFILKPTLEEKNFKIEIKEYSDYMIKTDPILLQQCLFNILKNSCEAVNYKGNVSLYYNLKGEILEIFVEDDGPGIKDDIKDKVFEPFFSTKIGRGTGLGLTITYAILKSMGGDLHFEKRKEKGTIVRLEIPYENINYRR